MMHFILGLITGIVLTGGLAIGMVIYLMEDLHDAFKTARELIKQQQLEKESVRPYR